MPLPNCDFCQIVSGNVSAQIVLRSKNYVAFFPLEPATLGHTLLIPTCHVADIWGLDSSAAAYLAEGVLRLAHALRRALSPEGLNVIQSNGRAATQTVDHLHVHLVPRWLDDAVGQIWPEQPETFSKSEKLAAAKSVALALENEEG